MHDPLTVAFDIKGLFREKPSSFCPKRYRYNLITIWHKDPCKGNGDDSCGWAFPHLSKAENEKAEDLIKNEVDNLRHWFPGATEYDMIRQVGQIFRIYKRLKRPWYMHPKWHIWHWRLQIHPWEKFYRWAFVRCEVCKGRFKWGESVAGYMSGIAHFKCAGMDV